MNSETAAKNFDNVTQIDKYKEEYKIAFSIHRYMVDLILPKCVIVHGEIVASIYLQLALNINHKKDSPKWQQNSCWMRSKLIAANTGYNVRVINSTIKKLETMGLISVTVNKAKRLRIIKLRHNHLKTSAEIQSFNQTMEKTLLAGANKTKAARLIASFRELEDAIDFSNPFRLKQITKSIWFPDINLLRKWVAQAESIYKGSSFFFIKHIAPQIFDFVNSNRDSSLACISEKQRATLSGSSQSTINRYIDAYVETGCITIIRSGINTPIELSLNQAFLKDCKNIEKRVVVCTMTNEQISCPICQKEFADYRSLSAHISNVIDSKHKLLNLLKKQTKSSDMHFLYNDNKEDFDGLDYSEPVREEKSKPEEAYMNIPCECSMSCKECRRTWKLDFYDDCQHERKTAFIKEYNIVDVETPAKKQEPIVKDNVDAEVEAPKKERAKKNFNPDTAPGLVGYFYSLNNGFCPNIKKENSLVKNALTLGVTPEGVRTTMRFLHRKGQIDLRFFNNASIREAHLELELMADTEKEGTEAYLVKMYYDGMGMPINISTIIKDTQKIKETMNTGLDYEQTKEIIQYLIDTKCPTLNFIVSKRNEALAKKKSGVITFAQNPCFYDKDPMYNARASLVEGSRKIPSLYEDYGDDVIVLAKKMFKESQFAERFTHFEWAWMIELELDLDMYKQAVENCKTKKFRLDAALEETDDEERIQKIIRFREKFYAWLNEQQEMFETAQAQ